MILHEPGHRSTPKLGGGESHANRRPPAGPSAGGSGIGGLGRKKRSG
jgi:hypothetical protein